MNRLRFAGVRPREGIHIGLCYPIPDHQAPIGVSALSHGLACYVVVQEFNCRSCDSTWIFEGNKYSAAVVQEFDCLVGAQAYGRW